MNLNAVGPANFRYIQEHPEEFERSKLVKAWAEKINQLLLKEVMLMALEGHPLEQGGSIKLSMNQIREREKPSESSVLHARGTPYFLPTLDKEGQAMIEVLYTSPDVGWDRVLFRFAAVDEIIFLAP